VYEELSAPTNLSATGGDGWVDLDWDDNPEASVVGYNVYRAFFSGSSHSKINDAPVSVSEYTDTTVNNGTTYYYVVRAVDGGGNESGNSTEVSASPAGNTSVKAIRDIGAILYPNPVGDLLHVRVENGVTGNVYDFSGRLVKSHMLKGPITSIPMSDLSSGMYLIRVQTLKGSGVYKLIKK
jgi:fibronectin type 3 domain-containing protein